MEKIGRNNDAFTFKFQFGQVKHFRSIALVYIPLLILALALYSLKYYQMVTFMVQGSQVTSSFLQNLPYFSLFIVQAVLIAIIILLGIVSFYVEGFTNIWAYLLLFSEAMGMIFVETTFQCFESSKWCEGEIKYQAGAVLIIVVYTGVIWVRSCFYYPFYDNGNFISMSSSSIVLFDLLYKVLLGAITNLIDSNDGQTQRKFLILLTISLYFIFNSSVFYCNPLIHSSLLLIYTFMGWTCLLIYLLPYFDVISTMASQFETKKENLFWYIWGYSMPCVLVYAFITNNGIDRKNGWKNLFLQRKHEIKNLENLYLMTSQLRERIKTIKKSQQKTNDHLFKLLWGLIKQHNQFCDHVQCPLTELKNLQIHRNDDFLEQKRLTKTLQHCNEFGLYHLERKKDKFPNLLQLSVQIANYELEVFQNRQKGLHLYSQFYRQPDIDEGEKYTLFYLKRKVEQMFMDNQNFSKTNTEGQLSEFRHNIEVSVSMLAEFWYFLADPKCNLKKLYDLANVLFPLKIGVDNEWKNIQKLKNIQSYYLYARYLIKMFNDKEKGMKILDEAKKLEQELKNKEEIEVDAEGNSNIGVEENGIIFLEFDGKNPGVMYQVNLAAQKIFGYNKGELTNRKVNDIMPRLFANYHDKILENYQQTNQSRMLNKERVVWGKSKDGYLFPFTILIKPVKNFLSQSSQVYASIRRETWVKQNAFLTLDMQDQISEVSASMLGIYPDLYGKVNLKKKMNITELIPNFAALKDKMIEDKQNVCELKVTRRFSVNDKASFRQITMYNLSMQEIRIQIAGLIGYILKFNKTVINDQKDLALSNIQQSGFKTNNFRFIYHIVDDGENQSGHSQEILEKKQAYLKYKGGVVHDIEEMNRSCLTNASRFFSKIPVEQEKLIQERQQIVYGQNIKTKRLYGKQIRQIHVVSEESEFDIAQVEKELQQSMGMGNIKPSELSSILEKEFGNSNVLALKLVTLLILAVSCLLCILQYTAVSGKHEEMLASYSKVRTMGQLKSEILYMKMYTTQFSSHLSTVQQRQMFRQEINLLDSYLDLYSYNTETQLTYNDGSSETMMLAFALNKLLSEANSIRNLNSIYPQDDSHVFFISFNTVNGLVTTTQIEKAAAFVSFQRKAESLNSNCILYISLAFGLFSLALLGKNIILRSVLKKKSQILEVFFEIPRKACTSIQKECQKFIQRLSSENQDDLEVVSIASDDSQAGFGGQKKHHKQKKRTIMGEQKTTNTYLIATLVFLLFLLFFHSFTLIYHHSKEKSVKFSMEASEMIFKLEEQAAIVTNFINSYILNQSIPFLQKNPSQSMNVIDQQYKQFEYLYGQLAVKFYLIGNIFDHEYLQQYNSLNYNDLCVMTKKNSTDCNTMYGENYGLNVIFSQYFNLINKKYYQLKGYVEDGTLNVTEKQTLLENGRLQSERQVQYLLKEYWRKMTQTVKGGMQRLLGDTNTILFAIMLTMCVLNFTVMMIGWLKFYHKLEQKIAATQYILTFIPIDQINKNPKIANYIKDEILEKR